MRKTLDVLMRILSGGGCTDFYSGIPVRYEDVRIDGVKLFNKGCIVVGTKTGRP